MKGRGQVAFAGWQSGVRATPEQLQRFCFGGGCERHVGDAGDTGTCRHFGGKDILTADLASVG